MGGSHKKKDLDWSVCRAEYLGEFLNPKPAAFNLKKVMLWDADASREHFPTFHEELTKHSTYTAQRLASMESSLAEADNLLGTVALMENFEVTPNLFQNLGELRNTDLPGAKPLGTMHKAMAITYG